MKFKYTKILVLAAAFIAACTYADKKPNIIFILADDMGYGDVSALNPDSKIKTPVLDAMAENGMIFTDAHTSSSVCTPSRYSLLTGRYNWRSSLKQGVLYGYDNPLIAQDRSTIASMLKESGYNTAMIGKWHLGWNWAILDKANEEGVAVKEAKSSKKSKGASKSKKKTSTKKIVNVDFSKPISNGPTTNGFDYFYGIVASLDMPPYVYVENDMATDTSNKKKIKSGGRSGPIASDLVLEDVMPNFAKRAAKYVKEHANQEKPFFLYLSLTGPHTPIVPTDEFKDKSGLNIYGDFVMETDAVLADIFKTLKEENIEDDTIVIFTADNACSPAAKIPELQAKGHYPNYVFRGNKADLFDGGHRVPCLVQWKGKFGKTIANQTICLTDFFATFADIAGYEIKDNEAEDSVNLMSIFNDANAPQVRTSTIHHSIDGDFAIRMGDWKLLVSASSSGWSYPHPTKDAKDVAKLPSLQLYNMKDDVSETKNLIKENPEKAKEMLAQLRKEVKDGRSTAGETQSNDQNGEWKQLQKLNKEYF